MSKPKPSGSEPKKGVGERRKLYLLIGILALIGLVSVWQMRARPVSYDSTTIASRTVPKSPARAGKDTVNSADVNLNYATLVKPRPVFQAEQRNIFSFHVPPPPKPVQMAGMGPNGEPGAPPAPPPKPPDPVCGDHVCEGGETYENGPADCEPVRQPITLKYIGYLVEAGTPVAFLTDGKEVYMGRVKDIIANKYRVIRISDDSVDLGYLNLPEKYSQKIPFEGNNKS